jgi:hypothetical protein
MDTDRMQTLFSYWPELSNQITKTNTFHMKLYNHMQNNIFKQIFFSIIRANRQK